MSHYIEKVTVSLENLISELARNPSLFLKNPDTDFSRNRKINFKTCVGITMNSGGCTLNKELLDFFDFDVNAPTVSAYTQQRAKILPEAFEYDPETLWKSNQLGATGNHLHLNALYDVLNRTYIDALVQTASTYQEHRACIQMIERVTLDKVILIADRGYENYNIMSHAIEKGWKFLIRIKDVHSNGIASGLELPQTAVFDMDINLILTRNQTKSKKQAGYKFMPTVQTFDYLPIGSKEDYPISFRIARFKIADDSYETVITNLDRFCFSAEKLKELYHLRWGIETSFRELKYAIGLTSFHAKKVDYIKQEIFARLALYNYCELITTYVVEHTENISKKNQVNFTIAIYICREYLRRKRKLRPPDVVKLIEKHILPIRPGRRDPRKVKLQASVSFLYRVA